MKTLANPKTLKHSIAIKMLCLATLTSVLFFGCRKESDPMADKPDAPSSGMSVKAKPDITVQQGGSIQSAVDAAEPGSLIKIMPGVYNESIMVTKEGITIKGTGNVIINNPGELEDGINVRPGANNFTLENVTIQNFKENGVFLVRVDNFVLRNVTTTNNGEYGLFPVVCTNGKIEHCTASGHSDTGIYVGQSTDIEISHSTAFANVLGIEVENCSRVKVSQNHTYDNVTGILAVLLPQLSRKESSDIWISKNIVSDNNHINFAPQDGGFESVVPSGVGILIVGTDRTTVEQNQVNGNKFIGIGVFSALTIGQLANIPPEAFDIEPNADFAKILNNNLVKNGAGPSPLPFLPAVDLIWDGSGTANCWSGNNFTSSVPSPLPSCN